MLAPSLPKLRENLSIYPQDGKKGSVGNWFVYDALVHKFYQVGYVEYLILSFWDLGAKDKIIDKIQNNFKKVIDPKHFDEFLVFLVKSRLLHKSPLTDELADNKATKSAKVAKLQKIFFLKFHIVNPDRFLQRALPYCRWMFSKILHFFMVLLIITGIFGVINNFASYSSTFVNYLDFSQIGLWMLAITIVKIFHEFAHAITSKYYGCGVSSMGIALVIFWPILYTDTTQAWSLHQKYKRILISSAGVISEIYLAAICTVLWLFLPDSTFKSVIFIISSTAWIASLFINLNPFMRFDGYFVLSDLVGIPNLHNTAKHYFNRKFDKNVLGMKPLPAMEYVRESQENKLAFFGILIWIYRLFLVLTISAVIYTKAFKLLAFALMLIYLTTSIIFPLCIKANRLYKSIKEGEYEVKVWIRSLLILALVVAVMVYPWRSSIEVPAIMHFKDSSVLYANSESFIEKNLITQGQKVKKGDKLLVLRSKSLEYEARKIELEKDILQWKIGASSLSDEFSALMQENLKEFEEKEAEAQSITEQKESLIVTAPHDGTVFIPNFYLNDGLALAKDQPILAVVDTEQRQIQGYINERDVSYFDGSKQVKFYKKGDAATVFDAEVYNVSSVGIEYLEFPYLASTYGGDINVREKSGGPNGQEKKLVPEKGIYSLKANVLKGKSSKNIDNRADVPMVVKGIMVAESKPHSMGKAFFDFIYSGFLKHSTF